uniref:Translation initiation factor 3 N-terminal domain-containing protein n=1 Tax=Glossina palpalis gambiensis TaxID=67801 RepID=A0A1B0ARQ6_9MUSC
MSSLLKSVALLNSIRCFLTKSGNLRDAYQAKEAYGNFRNLCRKRMSTTSTKIPNEVKKSKNPAKITLIQNQNVSVTTLEEAKNLAKRRAMHLIQLQELDTKTQRPVYKLLTNAEILVEELSELKSKDSNDAPAVIPTKPAQKKTEKSLNIGSRISENDLNARLKNIAKWLSKGHEVRILIQSTGNDTAKCDQVFKSIETFIKTPEEALGKIVQKHSKGTAIKFSILPVTNLATENADRGKLSPSQA